MADIFNPIFSMDASVILAKLHLAGKTQAPNFIVKNSAIIDENKSDTPEKPGNCKFNTDIKSGKFEIAFIHLPVFIYFKPIQLDKIKEYETFIKKNEKLGPYTPELLNGDKENANDKEDKSKITDEPDDSEDKKEIDEKGKAELVKAWTEFFKVVKKLKAKGKAIDALKLEEATLDAVNEAIKEENTARIEDFNNNIKIVLDRAIKDINNYFITFIGLDSFKQISDVKTLTLMVFNEATDDISKIEAKDFIVQGMDEKDLIKLEADFLKDQSKETKIKVGFKVASEIINIGL